LGSARVDKGTEPGMRDLGTYLRAGSNFMDGVDPYSDPAMRLGPSLLPLFGLLNNYFPNQFLAVMFQSFAMLGICYFVSQFANISFKEYPAIFLTILWFSSVRENLVNIQITGFLAFFFTFGCRLLKNERNYFYVFFGCLFIEFAVDTKPHLFGLAALMYILSIKKVPYMILVGIQILIIHILLSLFIGHLITLKWLQTLVGIYEIRSEGKLGESLIIWPLLENLGLSTRLSSSLSLVLFVSVTCLFLYGFKSKKVSNRQVMLLSFMIPSFGIFYHYYDLALAISLFFALAIISQIKEIALISLPLLLVPSGFLDAKNLVVTIGILIMLQIAGDLFTNMKAKSYFKALIFYSIYSITLLNTSENLMHQTQVTITFIFIGIATLFLKFQNRESIIPRKMD
jgi:hypothetical protein